MDSDWSILLSRHNSGTKVPFRIEFHFQPCGYVRNERRPPSTYFQNKPRTGVDRGEG